MALYGIQWVIIISILYIFMLYRKTLNKQHTIINKQVKKTGNDSPQAEKNRFICLRQIKISNVVDEIDNSNLGTHIAGQLIRSGSSHALNYGEAQSAESRKDFVYPVR